MIRFHKWGIPNSWMVYKGNPFLNWMIWGYPYFRKLPYVCMYIYNYIIIYIIVSLVMFQ